MHYTGPVYRPPPEAHTPLLEITYGCSWNKCSFCTMYHGQKFGASPLEDIKEDLEELSKYFPLDLKRLFLVNGDAFTLSTNKLLEISKLIHDYHPKIECLSAYASIRNIKTKSIDDLEKLKEEGFNDLYIGLETAYDPALKLMKKGYDSKDEYNQLSKLKEIGMDYNALLMLGVAGSGNYKENVNATVDLLNTFKPKIVGPLTTSIAENSHLYKMKTNQEFVEATEREKLNEELLLLEKLEMDDDCYFFGSHPYNLIRFSDNFKNKEKMIKNLKENMDKIDELKPGLLDSVLPRANL